MNSHQNVTNPNVKGIGSNVYIHIKFHEWATLQLASSLSAERELKIHRC